MTKKKIAVLGGGTGSMAAIWGLTSLPGWQDRYEITVYQKGWRLGGKGASGRNPDYHQRIEEHGLHVWAGFYENAFRVMREAYDEFEPPAHSPIQTWRDAFKPHNYVIVEERVGGEWYSWEVDWPPAPGVPGSGGEAPDVWGYLLKLLEWLADALDRSPVYNDLTSARGGEPTLWQALTGGDDDDSVTPETPERRGLPGLLERFSPVHLVRAASDFAGWLQPDARQHFRADHLAIIRMLEQAFETLRDEFEEELDEHPDARHLYYLLDMGLAIAKGILLDGVIFRGWDAIDIWEWREWMRRWGASDYSVEGVLTRGIYDYIFGFPGGNLSNPRVGAGTAIHGAMRLVFTYKEALFFFMQAGMGDIVFTPFYQVLQRRGVKFRFFSKVENLGVSDDGGQVDRITITEQASLTSGDPFGYEPLVDIKGVLSWPSHPDWDQLVEGETLRDRGINLESNWADWDGVGTLELERGVDFDEVILGIPPTAFPHICPELMEANERFKLMVDGLKSTQTQAVQLWFTPDREELGGPPEPAIVTAYEDPINTWSDMSHLLPRETWPEGEDAPKFVAYFCGPMEDAANIPGFDDHEFPARELERVKETARDWLSRYTGHIWTKAGTQSAPQALDYDKLHSDEAGVDRLWDQYFRANIDPSERYILSVPGSTAVRLKAGESGFENVTLAGDWVYTSISAGCIECAVMAGLHAAEAISGETLEIHDRAY